MTPQSNQLSKALSRIFHLLSLDKSDITSIYVLAILAGLVSLSLPLGIQSIIGFVQAGAISTSIVVLIVMVLAGTFLTGFLQVRQMQIIEKIEQKLFARYSLEYAERLPLLDLQKIDRYYLPELVNRFFDAPTLQKSLQKLLVDIPAAMIQIVFAVALLSFYHPLFIVFGLLLLIVLVLILNYTSKKGFSTSLETSDFKYRIAGWLEEIGRGVKTFKYAQTTTLHMQKMDDLLSGYFSTRSAHFRVLKFQYWVLILFKILITGAMLVLGVFLLIDQRINIGQFIAADIVIILLLSSVEKMIGNMDQVYDALTAVEKLDKVINAELEPSGDHLLPMSGEGVSIQMRDVCFGYGDDRNVLNQFNMEARPGEMVLIKGPSGSGKSSVLRLLTGAFKKRSGKILIGGLPIENYDAQSLRSQTGILLGMQDIFHGTLWENINLGASVTIDHLLQVARITGLIHFIENEQSGLETMLDPFGKRLPAKIRHQILLSRALLFKARLYLLEEPLKFLNEPEKKAMLNYLKDTGATVILTSSDDEINPFYNKILPLHVKE